MSAPAAAAPHRESPEAVAAALIDEARLLDMLADTFRRQRSAVASDDAQAVDDTVFAANRIMHTMTEARRRRRTLVQRLVGSPDIDLATLPELIGPVRDDVLHGAVDRINVAARGLAHEVETNRQLLRVALAAGDERIRALCGLTATPASYDGRASVVNAPASPGALLNRHA